MYGVSGVEFQTPRDERRSVLHLIRSPQKETEVNFPGLQYKFVNFWYLGGVPREQKMLKGHQPGVIYHQVYEYTKKNGRSTRLRQSSTGERGGNNLNGFKNFRTENGSSQGQNLALTGLFVPSSLGRARGRHMAWRAERSFMGE